MNRSDEINELAAALVAAQAEIQPVKLDRVNEFIGNKYASLSNVAEAVKGPLARHGLAVTQLVTTDPEGRIGLETILMHTSGQWISQVAFMEAVSEKGKSAAQVLGSAISYFRRYALAALLGVVSDDDTDGSAPRRARAARASEQPVSAPQGRPGRGPGRPPKSAAPAEPAPADPLPEMTLEQAGQVTNRDGVPYKNLTSHTLKLMYLAIKKAKNPLPEHGPKMAAIKLLLAERGESLPVEK